MDQIWVSLEENYCNKKSTRKNNPIKWTDCQRDGKILQNDKDDDRQAAIIGLDDIILWWVCEWIAIDKWVVYEDASSAA